MLLNADWHVLVNEVFHSHHLVLVAVHLPKQTVEHLLDFDALFVEIRFILLGMLHQAHVLRERLQRYHDPRVLLNCLVI